ncbi:MAG TPA: CHAT domain-containing protein, partial [Pseudonocardiaceae bacterium]
MTTLDLELEIGRGVGGSYPLLARMSGDEVTATMRLPLTFTELDHRLTVIKDEVLASAVRRPATGEDEQPARELGRELFEALLGDEVRELYAAGRARARADGGTLRLVLRVRPPELVRLPWEFMFDPGEQDDVGLSVSLARYPGVLAPRLPLPFEAPLRILGLVARPGEQHQADEEQQRLGAALAAVRREGLVELEWAAGRTVSDLQEALDRGPWHAFHFVGYGGGEPVADQRTVALTHVALTHDAGRDHLAGADDLTRLLADHDTLRLVVLNARDTGPGGASEAFSAAAGKLVRGGVPAVVAMQFDITDPAAIVFAETLYHNVARFVPVDTGVMRARRAVRLAKRDTLEWATPALYLRNPEGLVFTGAAGPDRSGAQPAGTRAGRPEVESRYDEALAAFWAEQWDQAIALLHKVLALDPDHPDAGAKLEQASREQDLATRYAQTRAALDTGEWEQAVAGFAALAEADPAYLDVRDLLADARRRRDSADQADQADQAEQAGDAVADPVPPPPELPRIARQPEAGLIVHSRMELSAVAFSPDGARLATASNKNVAQIWDTATGQELLTLGTKAWRRGMEGVAFSPDGDRLATASDDGTARIWDAGSGEEL